MTAPSHDNPGDPLSNGSGESAPPMHPEMMPTRIPVSRIRAGYRGALWLCLSAALLLPAVVIWPSLRFSPTATSNRFVEYSWAVVLVALVLAGLIVLAVAARWWALAFWPGHVGIFAEDQHLSFRLGPFGRRTFDWNRMTATYFFEMSLDMDALPDVLDPDEEVRDCLPRFDHPDASPGQLNTWLRSYVTLPQPEQVNALRLYIERIREIADADAPCDPD